MCYQEGFPETRFLWTSQFCAADEGEMLLIHLLQAPRDLVEIYHVFPQLISFKTDLLSDSSQRSLYLCPSFSSYFEHVPYLACPSLLLQRRGHFFIVVE